MRRRKLPCAVSYMLETIAANCSFVEQRVSQSSWEADSLSTTLGVRRG